MRPPPWHETAADAAAEIVGQMTPEARRAIVDGGIEGWREGVSLWVGEGWPHLAADDVLEAIEETCNAMDNDAGGEQ